MVYGTGVRPIGLWLVSCYNSNDKQIRQICKKLTTKDPVFHGAYIEIDDIHRG
jgi:hypothetical protein